MRKLAIIVVSTLVLAVAALLIAPQFIPADTYREQVVRRVEAATGRTMHIGGDISLRFLPRVKLTLQDVTLGNPPGFGAPADEPMIALRELQISLGFFDLLRGNVVIDRFELVEPVIRLARNARGDANWEFTPREEQPTTAASDTPAKKQGGFGGDLQLPNLEIRNGTLSYTAPGAEPLSLSALNATASLPSLTRTMTLSADTTWNGTLPVTLKAAIDNPAAWMDGRETAYDVTLTGDKLVTLTAKGKATPTAESLTAQGQVQLAVSSLKKLGKTLDMALLPDDVKGEGKLDLRGTFDYRDPQVALNDLSLTLDGLTVTGKAGVRLGDPRPLITADLSSTDTLVLDNYIAQDKPAPSGQAKGDAPAKSEGWSTEPVMADISALKAVDADIALRIGGLKYEKMTLGALAAKATLKNGTLNASIPEFAFYGGKAAANATVQATSANSLAIRKDATISNADIGQFLRDAADFDRLEGKGDLKFAISTAGVSTRDFVSRLDGNGALSLQNGAIRGFNLAETVREARALVQSVKNKDFTASLQSGTNDAVRTDFAAFSGSFTIDKGVVSNRDLNLQAPLLTVTGEGTVNLPQQSVDYRLRPTVVGSLEGEGRAQEASGELSIPMRVTGTFDALKFTPDASGLVQDAIRDPKGTVKDLEKNFKGLEKDVKSLFKGF